jgi:hypothetical protein
MFAAVKGQNARADAEIQITPFVYRIIHQFPLTAGVRFRTQGEVWQILEMEDIDHSYCELTVAYVGIPRRPRFGVPTRTQDFALALVNSERNEVSISVPTNAGFWGSDSLLGGLATGNFHQQFRDRRPRAGGPSIRGIDADWLRHAELYVLAASEGTTVILPFADSRITIPAAAEPASHGMAIGVEVAVP